MKGLQIFTHSLRQVTGNFPAAIKISGALYLVQIVIGLVLMLLGLQSNMSGSHMAGFGFGAVVSLIVIVITALWIAVAWHRYVLLVEQPGRAIPEFRAEQMRAYFLRSLVLGIGIVLMGALIGAVVGAVVVPIAMRSGPVVMTLLMGLLIQVPVMIIAFRISAALPGAAIGVEHPISAGWEATKGEWVPMLQLALIAAVLIFGINLLSIFVFAQIPVVGFVWQIVTGWFVMMVGISVLTTLYGHYIQKRPLL